jgi:hypothetical protein
VSLLADEVSGGGEPPRTVPHFSPKAKRVVQLLMAGAASHIDLFDYKPVTPTHLVPSRRQPYRPRAYTLP